MTLNIPNGLWDKYNEACEFFLESDYTSRECTIVYPPKRESCVNCVKPVGMSSTNVYRHGGPAPFNFGDCPLCGGNGYKENETTDTVRLRIYWSRQDWIRIAGSIVSPDAEAMIIGYMSDLNKIRQASHIILAEDNNEEIYRAIITGQPKPWGFGKNRYFVAFVKGA